MLLTDYIDSVYGTARGNRARFLKDNPDILPQELSRWLKAGLKIRPETGEIYKPVTRRVRIRGLTLSGTKTHVKQCFLPLTPLLMAANVLLLPVLPV
ncbi:hypothetical protein ACLEUK_19630 [Pseudescherichia vulneris]